MLRTARWSGIALLVGGCAASTPANSFTTTASPRDAVACLTAALDSANYTIAATDRRKGLVEATAPVKDPPRSNDPREFRVTDHLVFEAKKGGVWEVRTFGIRELGGTVVGTLKETVGVSPVGEKDAAVLAKRCAS